MHTVVEAEEEEEEEDDVTLDDSAGNVTVTVGWAVLLCTPVSALLVTVAWRPGQLFMELRGYRDGKEA